MKKILLWGLIGLLLCGLAMPAIANTPIKLFIDGQQAKIDSLLINGRTYVPARFVSESLGATVDYVDGVVKIYSTSGKSVSTPTANLPIKSVGEKIEYNNISYTIEKITYENKNSKQYVRLTFVEESNSSLGEFGLLPAFDIEQGSKVIRLNDYTVTAKTNKASDNTDYKRTFTYTFPWEGEVSYIYYYPQGSGKTVKPIGKWQR